MAAGSVISRDGGPRTSTGWAASARRCRSPRRCPDRRPRARRVPGISGFFSKDEILGFAVHRGGFYWIFAIGGYVGALLTAFYAFRIGFRVFCGEPCHEAQELEQGHLAPRPAREPRDRRGGGHRRRLPRRGASHRRARAGRCGWRCRCSASGALFAGLVADPGSRRRGRQLPGGHRSTTPSSTTDRADGRRRLSASRSAARSRSPASPSPTSRTCAGRDDAALTERFAALPRFLVNKWYFDELYRRPRLPPAAGRRPLLQRSSSGSSFRASSAAALDVVRGVGIVSAAPSPASCAPTRCC